MSTGARICPFCGKLNARQDNQCVRCSRRMPGQGEEATRRAVEGLLGEEAPLTRVFLIISVLIYFAMAVGGGSFVDIRISQALRWGALANHVADQPWRYLSAMFVHFSPWHIGLNSLMLYQLGRNAESTTGSSRFIVVFLVTGIAGFVAGDLWSGVLGLFGSGGGGPAPITGGISGGIFGLLGLAVGWRLAEGDPAWKRMAGTAVMYVVLTAVVMGAGVNHTAHLGGLVSGIACGWALCKWGRQRRLSAAFKAIATALVVTVFASAALANLDPTWQVQLLMEQQRR